MPARSRSYCMIFSIIAATLLISHAASVDTAGAPRHCMFPGKSKACPNSQRDWSVEWREASNVGPHELHLRQLRPRRDAIPVLTFSRHVDVVWNPDGRAIAVTDYVGSDSSRIVIVRTTAPDHPIDLEAELIRSLGRPMDIYRHGHRYFESPGWKSSNTLLFRVRAYDAEPGLEYVETFRYQIGGFVQRDRSE